MVDVQEVSERPGEKYGPVVDIEATTKYELDDSVI